MEELTAGANLIDPEAAKLNNIMVNAMHGAKLNYPANGGLDIESVAALGNMADQI